MKDIGEQIFEIDLDEIPETGSFLEGNEFSRFYKSIEDNPEEKRRLVWNDPEEAIRIFSVYSDREIGDYFVRAYGQDLRYNSAAYFIACELGVKIERLKHPSDFWIIPESIVMNPPHGREYLKMPNGQTT
ncbi:MAG: hypothetical protein Q8P57_02870 [Candidatus Pacearchaeota archaeon]|nr:hypothetical protein [Candidatus Pacearchaeota archaeon]